LCGEKTAAADDAFGTVGAFADFETTQKCVFNRT
jgi:hypothetical protein